jgi:hypothetical protein
VIHHSTGRDTSVLREDTESLTQRGLAAEQLLEVFKGRTETSRDNGRVINAAV